jgi:hypothetical protein
VGDGFVAALDSTGTNLLYSTYLGGSGDDQVNGIAVRPEDGTVVVTGFTDSPNFPQTNAIQSTGEQGFFTSSNAASVWNVSSPVLGNGIIYQIVLDPSNSLNIYALAGVSSGYAGVFKSTDGGATWTRQFSLGSVPAPTTGGSNGNAIANILAIDPLNSGTLYVASGSNLYMTTNGGANWNYVTSLPGFATIQSLVVDPVTTSNLYAGTASTGILKSTNSGTTWNRATNGLNNLNIQTVLIDAQNSSNLYAGAGGFPGSLCLYKSTNGGASWLLSTSGLPLQPVAGLYAHAGAIYAILGDSFESAYLYHSTDGLNWSQLITDGTMNFTALAFGAASGGLPALTIGRSGTNDVMSWPASFTGYTLQTSPLLNPSSWQNVAQSPVTNNGIVTVTIPMAGSQGYYRLLGTNSAPPYSPPAIYLGTDQVSQQGLLKSADGGVTWNSVGFAGNSIDTLAVNPANPATIYAGLNRGRDAFITTLTPSGQLYFSSFIGGGGADYGNAVALSFQDAYVVGSTSSSDFPTTATPAIATLAKDKPGHVQPAYSSGPTDGVNKVRDIFIEIFKQACSPCPASSQITLRGKVDVPFSEGADVKDKYVITGSGTLPPGVGIGRGINTGSSSDGYTFSGTPTESGSFTYILTLVRGDCTYTVTINFKISFS